MKTYRMHGITDETDTCELCGKIELRRVVMLAVLDDDGNAEEIVYAGTTCASRALAKRGKRVTASRVRDAAAAVDRLRVEAADFASEFAPVTFNRYVAANHEALLRFNGYDTMRALAAAKTQYAELQAEIKLIQAGKLEGTRFEKRLPVL